MIQFDDKGKARLLPNADGTIDIQERDLELRFLEILNPPTTKILKLNDGTILIKTRRKQL